MHLLCDHETFVKLVSYIILERFTVIARFIGFSFHALTQVHVYLDTGLFSLRDVFT